MDTCLFFFVSQLLFLFKYDLYKTCKVENYRLIRNDAVMNLVAQKT